MSHCQSQKHCIEISSPWISEPHLVFILVNENAKEARTRTAARKTCHATKPSKWTTCTFLILLYVVCLKRRVSKVCILNDDSYHHHHITIVTHSTFNTGKVMIKTTRRIVLYPFNRTYIHTYINGSIMKSWSKLPTCVSTYISWVYDRLCTWWVINLMNAASYIGIIYDITQWLC